MSNSNSNKTNSNDDESNSDDNKKSSSDESNLDDNLKRSISSIDLSKIALPSVDLSRIASLSANLSGITLLSANLPKMILPSADLSGIASLYADLPKMILPSADLSGIASLYADLSKIALPSADLSGIASLYANLSEITPLSANLPKMILPSADLSRIASLYADLSKIDLPSADLSRIASLYAGSSKLAIEIDNLQSIAPSSKQIKTIRSIFKSSIDHKKLYPEVIPLTNLKKSYEEGKLVFVFGSGVSRNYNLPDWNTLLQKLLLQILESKQKTFVGPEINVDKDLLITLFPQSPIVLARYIQLILNEDSKKLALENLVRELLYEEINDIEIDPIFKEVQKFCLSYKKVPCIDSVITFNFDDVLEKFLTSKVCESIYKAGIQPDTEKLSIYHVHGFLPRKENKEKLDHRNKITFSEDFYHQLYTDVYCWSNIVQIDKFTNNTCIFIGISLTDPNLRRLLDVAKKLRGNKSTPHYIIKERYNKEKIRNKVKRAVTTGNVDKLIESIEKYDSLDLLPFLIKRIEESERCDALSFGVNIIWVDNYKDEIPTILQKIRDS